MHRRAILLVSFVALVAAGCAVAGAQSLPSGESWRCDPVPTTGPPPAGTPAGAWSLVCTPQTATTATTTSTTPTTATSVTGTSSPTTQPTTTASSTTAPTTTSTSTSTTVATTTTRPTTTTTASPSTWPDATNTGVPDGTVLTQSGNITVTAANTVIDAKELRGGMITIAAANVTVKRTRLIGNGSNRYGIFVRSGDVHIEDSEITGNYVDTAVGFDNWTMERTEITGLPADGVKLGSNVRMESSWLHDFRMAAGAHADGGQVQSGITNTAVRGNSIDVGGNAALFIAPDLGPTTNGPLLIENNLLGGGNFTVQIVDGNNGQYFIRNITFRGNQFRRNATYGPLRTNVPVTQSGNVWADNGAPI